MVKSLELSIKSILNDSGQQTNSGEVFPARLKRNTRMTKYFCIALFFVVVFFSCADENMTFEIGKDYVNASTKLVYLDTLTLDTYTVRLDSLSTSGYNVLLAGRYSDPFLGNVNANGYFRVGLPLASATISDDAVFDSLQLILIPNGYAQGDTTSPFTLHVHRLIQTLKLRESGSLYNSSSFQHEENPLGSVTFRPDELENDSVKITIDSLLGKELFSLIREKDEQVASLDNFLLYLKGFIIKGVNENQAVLGFKVSDNIIMLRLYYHFFEFERVQRRLDFPLNNTSLQFNQVFYTEPLVDLPAEQKEKLPAKETDRVTFVQGGTGIATRIEIPYLKNILELRPNLKVLSAELEIEPLRNSGLAVPLPTQISLYTTDRLNRFGTPILNDRNETQVAKLFIDEVFQEDTKYTFNIGTFITAKLAEASDDIPALMLIITPNSLNQSVDRLVAGSRFHPENRMKLKIYYMYYE